MTAVIANRSLEMDYNPSDARFLPVAASTHLFQGTAIEPDAGKDMIALTAANDDFKGITLAECDNSDGADGDKTVETVLRGYLSGVTITGADGQDDFEKEVFLAGPDVLADLTLTSTSNTAFGRIAGYNAEEATFTVAFVAKTLFVDPTVA
jgi:hypothetical protein